MAAVSWVSLGGGEGDDALTLVLILFAVLLDAGLFCEAFLGFALGVLLLFVDAVDAGQKQEKKKQPNGTGWPSAKIVPD